jgi:hypothetical protein
MRAKTIFICISLGASILSIFSLYLPFYRWDDIDFNGFGKAMTLGHEPYGSNLITSDGYILDWDPPMMPVFFFLLLIINITGCLLALVPVIGFFAYFPLITFVIFGLAIPLLPPITPLFGQYICLPALILAFFCSLSYFFASR